MVETLARTFEVPDWVPQDTEESVMGTQWHQAAIDALATMLAEVQCIAELEGRDGG